MGCGDKSNQRSTYTGKKFLYGIDFEWRDGELNYTAIDYLPATLTMQDTHGRAYDIERV